MNHARSFGPCILDKRDQLIADEVMGQGTVDHAPVYPREVARRALEPSASSPDPGAQPPLGRSDPLLRPRQHDAPDRRGPALRCASPCTTSLVVGRDGTASLKARWGCSAELCSRMYLDGAVGKLYTPLAQGRICRGRKIILDW